MDAGVRVTETDARNRLVAWRDCAAWIDYVAAEFVADEWTRQYLAHVAVCVRDEAERRYAAAAGLEPVML